MLISDRELEEAGEKLLDPTPSSADQILSILDKVLRRISKVEQSPPQSTMSALNPLIRALVSPKLFRHSDVDVRVAVAACICHITRIAAPKLPYGCDQMKEVFKLIVSSFEHLSDSDMYGRSYGKRVLILEAVSVLGLFNVMFDLECDALVLEMFQHFLKGLRDYHLMKVFLCMENIMTLVIEESDDIPPEMLSLILHYVKKDDKIPQVSRRLAEQVLINCASKLKTHLAEAVKSSGVSLDKYSNVVASVCEGLFDALKQNAIVAHEKEDRQGPREVAVKDKEKAAEVSTSISSINKNGHDAAVSPRRETVAAEGVNTRESRTTHEITEEEETAESKIETRKRARVRSCSSHEAHGETAAEGEPPSRTHKSSPEPGDLQCDKLLKPCSFTHQLAKVKQSIVNTITSVGQFRSELETKENSIVDTLTSVRQFQSEIKRKEDNLKAWLQEFDVLGEKVSGIHTEASTHNQL